MKKISLTDEQASKLIHQINSLDGEIPAWFEAIRQQHITANEAVLASFEVPRKVYLHTSEWTRVSALWRAFVLSAGEHGYDDNGEYQIFSLTRDKK